MEVIYITHEQAIETHKKTIEYSGGGDMSILNIGYLDSVLEHIQNDDYYPLTSQYEGECDLHILYHLHVVF